MAIDIPKRRGTDKYGLRTMKVGDTQFFKMAWSEVPQAQRRIGSSARGRDLKIVTRSVIEDGDEGLRIWRIR